MKMILLLSCQDKPGLVSHISGFIYRHGGNIHSLDEHVDTDAGRFFIRVEWSMQDGAISLMKIEQAFAPLAQTFGADWCLWDQQQKRRVAIFVSRYDHCLRELLWRHELAEFPVEIPLIVSNHDALSKIAQQHAIPFYVFPKTASNKAEQEQKELELLARHEIDTIVLARYMQVLSADFVKRYESRIVNIHHSFLPAFIGGNPYRQAYERGVKIIGATSHYVTSLLDEGPIIEQDVVRISHGDSYSDLIRKGRDVERLVLARALELHCQHRVLVSGKKTIVFQ